MTQCRQPHSRSPRHKELAERLREEANAVRIGDMAPRFANRFLEAATLIEQQAARIDELEVALTRLSSSFTGGWAGMYRERADVIGEVEQIARAALASDGADVKSGE